MTRPSTGWPSFPLLLLVLSVFSCGDDGPVDPPSDPPQLRPCTLPDQRCREKVPLGNGFRLPVYRSLPLLEGDTLVEQAVIVVHGANRNPDDYFETMIVAARQAGALDRVLVIAPHFQTASDDPGEDEPYWSSNGWKRGNQSNSNSTDQDGIGSYEAVDRILALLDDPTRFPRLARIVVTGHSAGGQYTHRFAAGSRVEEGRPHLRFRYIVANPSTFLYLGPERVGQGEGGGWGIPDRAACPDYNHWHYGLEEMNPYMEGQEPEEIQDRLQGRDVVLLAGDADTGSSMLDVSCGAMLQGPNRYYRARYLFAFMKRFFPDSGHRLVEIPRVGHSSRDVYTSPQGQESLFTW